MDPQVVESIPNLKLLRQALFYITTKALRVVEKSAPERLSDESKSLPSELHAAYEASCVSAGELDIELISDVFLLP
jgi:hypothetical protein